MCAKLSDESVVLVGKRKSHPQVFLATEAEVGSSTLRHRYSSGSSSVGSSGTPTTTCSPPSFTSTPHTKGITMRYFGTPGSCSTVYGSFQPSSYTEAYVPPLSLDREKPMSYQNEERNPEHSIRVDSGYGRNIDDSFSSSMPRPRHNLFSNYGSSPSLWDTLVTSPVQNLKQKFKGKPSYVDEGSGSTGCKVKPKQVLACLIVILIVTSIVLFLTISYKHFNQSKNDNVTKIIVSENLSYLDNVEEIISENGRLKDDIKINEIIMKAEQELRDKIISQSILIPKQPLNEGEAEVLSKLAVSVLDVLSKNDSFEDDIEEMERSDTTVESVDYPDDPTFRGDRSVRKKRDDAADQDVLGGEKFRKFKDDKSGGFRKKGVIEDVRDK